MRRRDVLTMAGGAATTGALWPFTIRAQPRGRMRRIGMFINLAADDPEVLARVATIAQGLQELGWTVGRNVRIDYRWGGAGDPDKIRKYAFELVALAPDVILSNSGTVVRALQQVSRTVPIIFAGVTDPVGAGLVASLARPGGNATGFTNFEYGVAAKWLELLKPIAPRVTRAAVIRDPTGGGGQLGATQAVAPSFGVELSPIDARDAADIERDIAVFAGRPTGGLIVVQGGSAAGHRDLIIALAARHHLPAVYPGRHFATGGGLISYGPDVTDEYRQAAGYVDRILKGEKPADLPVQAPTKYELVVNLKTAKALGLDVPATVLARADEVIE